MDVSKSYKPWITDDLTVLKHNTRRKAERKWLKSQDKTDYESYRTKCKEFSEYEQKAQIEYLRHEMESKDSKQFFESCSYLIKGQKKNKPIFQKL